MIAALLWGLAEATLFFIVPDVLLSLVAVHNRRRALHACLWAVGGALIGGTVMHTWGAANPAAVVAALAAVPAIDPPMIESVSAELETFGAAAAFIGPIRMVPYKIYAAMAPATGVGLPVFLLLSLPARLLRFVGIVLAAGWVLPRITARLSTSQRLWLLGLSWAGFYAVYLTLRTSL
jgi:hypothetical protein